MDNPYATLLHFPTRQSPEASKAMPLSFTERHMQVLWLEQKSWKQLITSEGDGVQVLSPGIWNTQAGPDFLKAHIILGDKELKGDIEIHIHDQSWYHHHHHTDERYKDVILHVSLWQTNAVRPLIKCTGEAMPRLYLEKQLTVSLPTVVQNIDLDLYPYKQFVGSGMCAHELYRTLPRKEAQKIFEMAALWRLQKKWLFLQSYSKSDSNIFSVGCALALGYKKNAESFLQIFLWLQQQSERDFSTIFSWTLGICGFFDAPHRKKWECCAFYKYLDDIWMQWKDKISLRKQLHLHQIRPVNHPTRRLAALVLLLLDPTVASSVASNILHIWQRHWPHIGQKAAAEKELARDLLQQIPQYTHKYWSYHYTFGHKREQPLALIGADLQQEILLNVLLPIMQTAIIKNHCHEEEKAFCLFFASLSATKAQKLQYLSHRFFGDGNNASLVASAQTQQGAYQIHKDFCMHYEASCIGCPFVKNYKQNLTFPKNIQ